VLKLLSMFKVIARHYQNCKELRTLLNQKSTEMIESLHWYDMTVREATSFRGFIRVALYYLRNAQQDLVASYYGAATLYWARPTGDGLTTSMPTVWTCKNLNSSPWYKADDKWAQRLTKAHEAIAADYKRVEEKRHPNPASAEDVDKGRWDNVFLTDVHGNVNSEIAEDCKDTMALISEFPLCTNFGFVFFSETAPGTHIKAHTGGSNLRLRYHLPLVVPEPEHNRMRVADEVRHWQQGEVFAFDDSYDHEVWNDGTHRRSLLIIDLWHPELSPSDVAFLSNPLLNRFGKTG
jgi:hypothetical protein